MRAFDSDWWDFTAPQVKVELMSVIHIHIDVNTHLFYSTSNARQNKCEWQPIVLIQCYGSSLSYFMLFWFHSAALAEFLLRVSDMIIFPKTLRFSLPELKGTSSTVFFFLWLLFRVLCYSFIWLLVAGKLMTGFCHQSIWREQCSKTGDHLSGKKDKM